MTDRTESTISLAWKRSTGKVKRYHLYRGRVRVGKTRTTSHTFRRLACGRSYRLAVRASDGAGHRSRKARITASTAACSPADGSVGASLPATLPPSLGTTYYVSTSGSDSNPGSADAPWRTVQKALDTLLPGETALVRGGTYVEDLLAERDGTAEAPITVAAYPDETVSLQPASTTGDTYSIIFYGASYVRLRGFVLEGSDGTSAAAAYVTGSSHHIELADNEIRENQDQGFFADKTTSHVYLLGNVIHSNGLTRVEGQHQNHGIYLKGSYDLVANNLIYNHPYGFGLHIYDANHDTIVVNNTIAASGHSAIVVGGPSGVYNIEIRNNVLYDTNWGVQMDTTCPTGRITIERNLIHDYKLGPIQSSCSTVTAGGNLFANPSFVDYAARDLRLQADSPAVDVALTEWSAPRDVEGRSRPQGAGPDIGAFEREGL